MSLLHKIKMEKIYLDYNATTPVSGKAKKAAIQAMEHGWGNPGCLHDAGLAARRLLESARESLARLILAHEDEILFLSGGTEANNTVLLSIFPGLCSGRTGHLITSQIEHPSVLKPAIRLMEMGYHCTFLRVDANGVVSPRELEAAIRPETRLVSIMLANNELGTIQAIQTLNTIAKKHDILFHTDASQAIGKIEVDARALGVDYLTMAGHKFYAPKGIGALYVRKGAPFVPMFLGGGQEGGMRPGTESVVLIAALGASARETRSTLQEERERLRLLRDRLFHGLRAGIGEDRVVNNIDLSLSLPNTLSVRFRGLRGKDLLALSSMVMASTGAACHEGGKTSVSHVLSAIGLKGNEVLETVRLSIGRYTTEDHIDLAVEDMVKAYEKALSSCNASSTNGQHTETRRKIH